MFRQLALDHAAIIIAVIAIVVVVGAGACPIGIAAVVGIGFGIVATLAIIGTGPGPRFVAVRPASIVVGRCAIIAPEIGARLARVGARISAKFITAVVHKIERV